GVGDKEGRAGGGGGQGDEVALAEGQGILGRPGDENDGRGVPLAGHEMGVRRHIDGRLQAEQDGKAGSRKARERILGTPGVMKAAQDDEGKQSNEQQTQYDAEFFGGDRKHEIGMTLRQDALDRALAGAAPQPTAALEGFESLVDGETIARGRITEAFDATRYVRDEHISAGKSDGSDATKPRNPYESHAGKEEQHAPD